MRMYDVYRVRDLDACVCIHHDGQKTWEFTPEWQGFWVNDHKMDIERAIDICPNYDELTLSGFTIRRRPA
jgi:hypothetical protein